MYKRLCTILLLLGLYLGVHNGYLALYHTGASNPHRILPYRAALYPKIDQQALETGIPISSESQLKTLLEDFLS